MQPEIVTKRLILSRPSYEDFPGLKALWSDAIVSRVLGREPISDASARRELEQCLNHWSERGYGYFVARDRGSLALVGEVGFANTGLRTHPRLIGAPEMAWALTPSYWGLGLALEAGNGALEWADRRLGGPIVCMVHVDNKRSLRVADKLRFVAFGQADRNGMPMAILERNRTTLTAL